MNFRVVDDQGKLLDYGRDLKKLQAKHGVVAGDSFDQLAADELNYTGCIQWAFDDLPDTRQFMLRGQSFIGYPAIVDEGDAVGVRLFDTERKAAQQHRAGLMRLYQLQLRKECTYIQKNAPQSAAAELAYQRLPKHSIIQYQPSGSFKEDLLFCVLSHVFIDGRTIRSKEAFERNLQQSKPNLIAAANEIGKIVLDIMQQYAEIKTRLQRLNANDPLSKDINQQLDLLIYAGFIRHTPYDQLKAIPRYLKAALYRLDKLSNDPQKNQEIQRYSIRFWQEVEKKSKKETIIPELDPFRWALEEFRVSLYAQQLKTAYPVSAKRLEKAWDERG